MKRILLGLLALVGLGTAAALSGVGGGGLKTFFPREDRNPVTHLRWNDSPDEFQFAIVSDRTGGHRANIFSQAVEKLNLMQPSSRSATSSKGRRKKKRSRSSGRSSTPTSTA
jgi:hypothetical protein